MTSTEKPQDVPDGRPGSLDRLNVLVGQWETTATFDAGFFGPDSPETTVRGRVRFEWLDGRFFLTQRFVNEHPDTPSGLAVIGVSEGDTFVQHYYDSRGVERVYQLTLDGRELRLWRRSPGFSQRYSGMISEDSNTINGAWEASPDGQEWRHDFALAYTRTG
jgi:hypothetical protein